MRMALDLEKEIAEKLRQLAEAQNLSVEQLLAVYVPGLAPETTEKYGVETEDKAQAFEAWVSSFAGDTPPLLDADVSRASIYRDPTVRRHG